MSRLISVTEDFENCKKHVIFFHGLGGHPFNSWSFQKSGKGLLNWLDEEKSLSVWTVGYEAPVSRWSGRTGMHYTDRATNLLRLITTEPELNTGTIILIGHSLGGLIIKQILRNADSIANSESGVRCFLSRVRKIGFLGTPHAGADTATIADRLRIFIRPSVATKSLVRNNPNLRDLNYWYREWVSSKQIDHLILIESKPIKILGVIVQPDSSDPGIFTRPISVDEDHISLSKALDRKSDVFKFVHDFIHTDSAKSKTLLEDVNYDIKVIKEEVLGLRSDFKDDTVNITEMINERISNVSSQYDQNLYPTSLVDHEIIEKLKRIRKARYFKEYSTQKEALHLADRLTDGDLSGGDNIQRCVALGWCARFLAYSEQKAKAKDILLIAKKIGSDEVIDIASAFLCSGDGDLQSSLHMLNRFETPASRTASIMCVEHHYDDIDFFKWIDQSGIKFDELDSDGKFFYLHKILYNKGWDKAFRFVQEGIHEEDYLSSPILYHVAALTYLVQALPIEIRQQVLSHPPFQLNSLRLAANDTALNNRSKAKELFLKSASEANDLGCEVASDIAEDYALWLELEDPKDRHIGLQKLKESMRDSQKSLRRLHFALQYGLTIDFDAVEKEVNRQTAFSGGKSLNAAVARFSIIFTKTPAEVVDYIDEHRKQLEGALGKLSLVPIEIEALARAGKTEKARKVLANIETNFFSANEKKILERNISECEGTVDSLKDRISSFESSGELNDLVILVNYLEDTSDWERLEQFGSILFERTGALSDAILYSTALSKSKNYRALTDLYDRHSELEEQSDDLSSIWAWALYYEGRINDSQQLVNCMYTIRNRTKSGNRGNTSLSSFDI